MGPYDSFVNVSSTCGLYPTAQLATYCATKFAVIGFSRCVALEVGPRAIRVNAIAPGNIITPMNVSIQAGEGRTAEVSNNIGLRRFGTSEEVAEAAVFLLGPGSNYINGSVLEISGGTSVNG